MVGQVELNNQITRLRESVERTPNDESKYLLHHVRNDKWLIVSKHGAIHEMDTGLYDGWRGPFDEAVVSSVKHEQNDALRDRKLRQPAQRTRTQDELLAQIQQVRRQHCIGI